MTIESLTGSWLRRTGLVLALVLTLASCAQPPADIIGDAG
jgi:hypothetical protein